MQRKRIDTQSHTNVHKTIEINVLFAFTSLLYIAVCETRRMYTQVVFICFLKSEVIFPITLQICHYNTNLLRCKQTWLLKRMGDDTLIVTSETHPQMIKR